MYISSYCRLALVPPNFTKFGIRGQLIDVITCVKLLINRFRGNGVLTLLKLPFPIDLLRRPYNSVALSCDTVLYAVCNNEDDHRVIQSDLEKWANDWQMKFNVKNCKIIHLGHSNSKLQYWLDGNVLNSTSCEDLGVWISRDLKLTHHITEACKKANRMLEMMKRTIVYKNPYIPVTLYKSLVCPHLEYSCSAWSPHYQKDKELLKKVQRRFTRMCKELDYYDHLQSLGLWTLLVSVVCLTGQFLGRSPKKSAVVTGDESFQSITCTDNLNYHLLGSNYCCHYA